MLHLGWILRGGVDGELIVLARYRDRRLRLEVEVILPAVHPDALDHVVGLGEATLQVAAPDVAYGTDEVVALLRFVDREDRLERLDVDFDRRLRRLDRLARLRRDDDDRLTDEHDDVLGEEDFVLQDRPEDVVREVVMREERNDAGDAAGGGRIDRADASMRDRRPVEVDDHLAAQRRHVIDVDRLAGNVTACGIVRDVASDGCHGAIS